MKIIKKLFTITAIALVSVLLVSCNKEGSVPKGLKEAYEKLDYAYILGTNESKDKVKTKLNLVTSIEGVNLFWSSSDSAVITDEGDVKRPATDKAVTLTVSLTKDDLTANKEFKFTVLAAEAIGSEDVDGTVTHAFDFTGLTENTSYVKTETDTVLKNTKDNTDFTFLRYYANISTSKAGNKGVVLGSREKDGYPSPHIRTSVAINKLVGVEFSFTNWVSDLYFNFDAIADALLLEVSEDGAAWTTVKDLTADIDKEKDSVNTFKLNVENPDNKALYVRLRLVVKDSVDSTFSLRLILTNMSFYTK